MSEEVRILGRFTPSEWNQDVIEAELRRLLPPCCQRERISIRVPHAGAIRSPDANREWHQDGGGIEGTARHMVVWASEQPTELRTSAGELVIVTPFDLVWFDNDKAMHRQPRDTDETTRWFVSVRCSGATA